MPRSVSPKALIAIILCIALLIFNTPVYGISGLDLVDFSVESCNEVVAEGNATLAQTMQSISGILDWESAVYAGLLFDERNKTDLEIMIDNYAAQEKWSDVLFWSVACKKLGVEREDAIRAALNGLPMVGPLPWTNEYLGFNWFGVEHKYALFGYQYAEDYEYRLDKWNKTEAYNFFKIAIDNVGHPVLFIDASGRTYNVSYGPRYYDEAACTIQCYLTFYELGIEDGLDEALRWWDWTNNNLWYQNTHYKYGLAWPNYECEAGFFAKVISNLKYHYPSLGNWSRIASDLQSRFLVDKWNSKQWFSSSENTTTYSVVHHYPFNAQRRLQNTLGAWTAMHNLYDDFDNASQHAMQEMLEGSDGDLPAWELLMSSIARLYDNISQMFRWMSNLGPSQDATAFALASMFFMGIVPKTAVLAIPIEEYSYEYFYDIDPELYGVNLENRTIRLAIRKIGEIEFIFGTTPVSYSFMECGVFELLFSSDWNTIQYANKTQDLPSNRKFVQIEHDVSITKIVFSNSEPFVNEPVTINVSLGNKGDFPETFELLLKDGVSVISNHTITLMLQESITVSFAWTPITPGNHAIVAFTSDLEHDVYPQDNTITGHAYVKHGYCGSWGIFLLTY